MNRKLKSYRDKLGGRCQLCGQVSNEVLQLDHCHTSELARGFLCRGCNNRVIPISEKTPELVSQLVLDYLSNPPLLAWRVRVKNQPESSYYGGRQSDRSDGLYINNRIGSTRDVYKGEVKIARINIRDEGFLDSYRWWAQVVFISKQSITKQSFTMSGGANTFGEDMILDEIIMRLRLK